MSGALGSQVCSGLRGILIGRPIEDANGLVVWFMAGSGGAGGV